MNYLKRKHKCELFHTYSALPELPPNASAWTHFRKKCRGLVLATESNPRTKFVFRSMVSIQMENQRQLKYFSKVAHPFSVLAKYREIIMSLVWLFSFTFDTFTKAFSNEGVMKALMKLMDVVQTVHIVASFFIGYYDYSLQEAVLDHKRIRKRYLVSYFLIDVFKVCPFERFLTGISLMVFETLSDVMVLARVYTMCQFFRQITLKFELGDLHHELICLTLGAFVLTNLSSSFVYLIPKSMAVITGKAIPDSWTHGLNLTMASNVSMATRYIQSLHKASGHLFACSKGMWISENPFECIMFSVIILFGLMYFGYVMALVFVLTKSYRISENKYEHMFGQLNLYLQAKKFPLRMRTKLHYYYKNRFKQSFFNEISILDTLSEHLQHEITLFQCKPLIRRAWFFEGLPKSVVGHIIASLERTVIMPNDVAQNNSDDPQFIYFITRGTLSVVLDTGKELRHIYDGDYFGEMPILAKHTTYRMSSVTANLKYVAVEFTELYGLPRRDFKRYVLSNEQAMEKLVQTAYQRDEYLNDVDERTHVVNNRLIETSHKIGIGHGLFRR